VLGGEKESEGGAEVGDEILDPTARRVLSVSGRPELLKIDFLFFFFFLNKTA
jgi:hypothetical protein